MDVVSVSPLRTASLLWQPRVGVWALTVVGKATFDLRQGASTLASEQRPADEGDVPWDDPGGSLHAPTDLVPAKQRSDVLLVGHAYAPRGEPVRSLGVRLLVGTVNKSLKAYADRSWAADGTVREGAPFARMPLRYERAAGGPGTDNPVGVPLDAATRGGPLPNLQPITHQRLYPGERVDTVCFGPLAPSWPSRLAKLGPHAAAWSLEAYQERALPEDLDRGYFNAAPLDQQVDALRADEDLVLDNLHPEHARLVTRLPGARPRAFIERKDAPPRELSMSCDTLWIDTDRSICTLTWRAWVVLKAPAEPGRVIVGMETPGQEVTWTDLARRAGGWSLGPPSSLERAEEPSTITQDSTSRRPALPFVGGAAPSGPPSRPRPPTEAAGDMAPFPERASTLPFLRGSAPRAAALPFTMGETPKPPPQAFVGGSVPPAAPPAAPPVEPPQADVASLAAPPLPSVASPWAAGSVALSASRMGVEPPAPAAPVATGLVAASNAAADPPRPAATPAGRAALRDATEAVDLLWFDPACVARLRKKPGWKEIIQEIEERDADADLDDAAGSDDPQAIEDRRDLFEVIARGAAEGGPGIGEALSAAVRADGKFVPPLILVAGELELPFSELETLKATLTVVTPLVGADKKLKETLDTVAALLDAAEADGSGGIAERLTAQVRDAYGQVSRLLSAKDLDLQVERMLIAKRHYQRREVLDALWIRGLLRVPGASAAIPAYLPDALAKLLPLYPRFRVRLLAELTMQQDPYEAQPTALRALALGRVVAVPLR